MPRKIKAARNVSDKFIAQLGEVGRDFLPHDPVLAGMAVAALLFRVEERNKLEAQYLRYSLQMLATMERQFPGLQVSELKNDRELNWLIQKALRTTLRNLVYGKPGRHEHYVPFLRLQRDYLVQYFNRHPYPQQAARREAWLQAHARPIWTLLSQLKCLCRYSKSLLSLPLDDLNWSRTPGRVIWLLLAELHHATPAQIQKLLSHSPRASR